jgi:transposase
VAAARRRRRPDRRARSAARRGPRGPRGGRCERRKLAALVTERDQLRVAYQELQHELALMRRRLFAAKAERLDTAQLELELGQKLAALDELNRELGLAHGARRGRRRRLGEAEEREQAQADGPARPARRRVAGGAGRADRSRARGQRRAHRLGGEHAVDAWRRGASSG